ncbi:MAG: alpha-glucan family phosphorylase [Patescibacteria group bacterium]|nr:alpha-glucan family phosphorylase [Patescibacteria group bacterium]MDE1988275.1 alpha-glucan family phosphorylase [Patescibacteria group bacterium]MDE2218302.1 alpha-glucan family phosphorylase [Patescibacteria group bacterium]
MDEYVMEELNKNIKWFEDFKKSQEYRGFLKEPVAYFCAEFALESDMPTYIGGLGVLSGDYVKEAADRKFPIIGVGLFYNESREFDENSPGKNNGTKETDSRENGLSLVVDEKDNRVLISLPIHDRVVHAQAWSWTKRGVTVYLLDTNITENEQNDRKITARLYIPDKETRVKQEMVLGIGGSRLLQALKIHPSVYHLNEGHSSFLALELARYETERRNVDFVNACTFASQHIAFTNHTLVPAGNELFSKDLVSAMMYKYAEDLQVPITELVSLGSIKDSSLFSMTTLSLRFSSKINAVSALHCKKAVEIFSLYKMENVTNGIYVEGWDSLKTESKNEIWKKHQENKKTLLSLIKDKSGESWNENTLLIGWARRFVPYKRPLAILEDIKELKKIAEAKGREMKIVFAGHASEGDEEGKKIFDEVRRIIAEELKGIAVFLPNYNLELAKLLTSGCDVWLNTPVVGSEACGTSGMKAALNGALPLTTKDGWVDEVNLDGIGWILENTDINRKILEILDKSVVPMYYKHLENPNDSASEWLARMEKARELILVKFSMSRAFREYIENIYLPISKQKHQI